MITQLVMKKISIINLKILCYKQILVNLNLVLKIKCCKHVRLYFC